MNEVGHFALCLAWFLSLYATVAGAIAGYKKSAKLYLSTVNASVLLFAALALSIVALAYGFVTDDYTNQYVWQYSNKDMQNVYKISAIWGGMDGSMLLWCFILSVSICLLSVQSLKVSGNIMPWVLSVANSSALFFVTVVLYFTNPFRYLKSAYISPDGNGLNPLLQNPYMAVHPPMLYMGFTTLAIPYAFCMGALLSGTLSNEWLRLTRRWILIAWAFLTAGIVMGGHWAYLELGWGGFWAWDPVENASFLPWLTATAFLHSVMVQERKNMLKIWNVWLVVATYALTVFGTFLTRSGVVQSVHAFASTDIGWIFLVYLGLLIGFALVLTIYRKNELKSERKIESIFSREAAFLVNNLIFLSICFAVLWGVLFPVFSEAITGERQSIGIPFYNAINVPLFLFLILLMGVGPLIAWKRASFKSILKTFFMPFLLAIVFSVVLMYSGVKGFYPLLSYGLCFFVLMTIFLEYHRALKIHRASADNDKSLVASSAKLLKRHSNRYIGYLIHIGVLVMAVSITASMAHKVEEEFSLSLNEVFNIGRYNLKLERVLPKETQNYNAVYADVSVHTAEDNKFYASLHPEMRAYLRNNEQTTEVALKMGLREDLYLVLAGINEDGSRASFKVFINPLQVWLWFGTLIVVFGTILLIIPRVKNA